MEHYKRIQNAIEFIERNLDRELNITEISSEANFSPFHFQRLFQAILGYSVQGYVRSRRLSESAKVLRSTEMSILKIALEYNYNSHESYTRAFKSMFGVTPSKYRKDSDLIIHIAKKADLIEEKNCCCTDITNLGKPIISYHSEIKIVGYEYKTSLVDFKYFKDIPNFYSDFGSNKYYERIPYRKRPAYAFGINCNYKDSGEFSFLIGEEVHQLINEPKSNLLTFTIPSGRYAEFTVLGSVNEVQNAWKYIYGVWLPNSNYEMSKRSDYEVNNVCRSVYPDRMVTSIYIPIN